MFVLASARTNHEGGLPDAPRWQRCRLLRVPSALRDWICRLVGAQSWQRCRLLRVPSALRNWIYLFLGAQSWQRCRLLRVPSALRDWMCLFLGAQSWQRCRLLRVPSALRDWMRQVLECHESVASIGRSELYCTLGRLKLDELALHFRHSLSARRQVVASSKNPKLLLADEELNLQQTAQESQLFCSDCLWR